MPYQHEDEPTESTAWRAAWQAWIERMEYMECTPPGSGVELRSRGEEEVQHPTNLTGVAIIDGDHVVSSAPAYADLWEQLYGAPAADWERPRNTTWEEYVDWQDGAFTGTMDMHPEGTRRPPITCWWCGTVNTVQQYANGIMRCVQCNRDIS